MQISFSTISNNTGTPALNNVSGSATMANSILAQSSGPACGGTVTSANAARSLYPNADIRVIDMRTIAGCLGEVVKLAVAWRDAGLSPDEIEARLKALIPRSRTYFLVATLEYLQRNGRIGGASRLIGSMLQIKPILQLSDGHSPVVVALW